LSAVCTGRRKLRRHWLDRLSGKTAGGIAGKVKKNDNGYLGTVSNCFVYADILVRGEGDENGAAGGGPARSPTAGASTTASSAAASPCSVKRPTA
jgi:hypothetical protein